MAFVYLIFYVKGYIRLETASFTRLCESLVRPPLTVKELHNRHKKTDDMGITILTHLHQRVNLERHMLTLIRGHLEGRSSVG
jgi:hypothetical protein